MKFNSPLPTDLLGEINKAAKILQGFISTPTKVVSLV
jgi:hypothetical protein